MPAIIERIAVTLRFFCDLDILRGVLTNELEDAEEQKVDADGPTQEFGPN